MSATRIATAEDMRAFGAELSRECTAGDVIVLAGDLGAGKTTLVQGMGAELGVTERITSPTFVISRVHPTSTGVDLVHMDAYRLGGALELDDLDIDVANSIVVIEWGEQAGRQLADEYLVLRIERSDDEGDEVRTITREAHGPRWASAQSATSQGDRA